MTLLGLFDALRPSFLHALDLGPGFGFLFFAHIVPSVFHPRTERRMTVGRMALVSFRLTMVSATMIAAGFGVRFTMVTGLAVRFAVVAAGSGVITVTFAAMTFPSFFNALLPSRLHPFAGLGSLLFTHVAPSFSPVG